MLDVKRVSYIILKTWYFYYMLVINKYFLFNSQYSFYKKRFEKIENKILSLIKIHAINDWLFALIFKLPLWAPFITAARPLMRLDRLVCGHLSKCGLTVKLRLDRLRKIILRTRSLCTSAVPRHNLYRLNSMGAKT